MKNIITTLVLILMVSACSKVQSQNQYSTDEVGQPINIDYAIILDVRPVQITGRAGGSSGGSPLSGVGSAAGPAGAYVDTELGNIWGSSVGAAEVAASGKKGYEYTIFTESKATKVIVQYQDPTDIVFKPGDLVMLQNSGSFHRLLSTVDIPAKIKKAHLDKIEDEEIEAAPVPLPPPAKPADTRPVDPKPADPAPPSVSKKEGDR